ncbi:hypothetical protein M0R04_14910 [Candidatus Dojkabacteria bacterium]|jgi:hypothetical protein|nr:hypothetical protein [Candidatus Dojkabacteria bacterium]
MKEDVIEVKMLLTEHMQQNTINVLYKLLSQNASMLDNENTAVHYVIDRIKAGVKL